MDAPACFTYVAEPAPVLQRNPVLYKLPPFPLVVEVSKKHEEGVCVIQMTVSLNLPRIETL